MEELLFWWLFYSYRRFRFTELKHYTIQVREWYNVHDLRSSPPLAELQSLRYHLKQPVKPTSQEDGQSVVK